MKKLAVIIVSILLTGCAAPGKSTDKKFINMNIREHKIRAEVPRTKDEMMEGLMFRKELPENQGML